MSTYEELLDEIVARLKGSAEHPAFEEAGIEVHKSPETTTAHEKLNPNKKTRIRVSFMQDRYGTDENDTTRDVGTSVMDRIIYFNLSVESRARYGEKGALAICENAMRMLLGYKSTKYGGELYAFATAYENYEDDIWYHRVVVRWKDLPMKPMDSFRITGDENMDATGPLDPGTPAYITEVIFTPQQIAVLDGQTPGYLNYFSDESGNIFKIPEGYMIVKK